MIEMKMRVDDGPGSRGNQTSWCFGIKRAGWQVTGQDGGERRAATLDRADIGGVGAGAA
jgi:hypothetical protein